MATILYAKIIHKNNTENWTAEKEKKTAENVRRAQKEMEP